MNNFSILVVDDEPRNFDVIESLLSKEPYELQYASSGQECFESLEIMSLDLILLDVMMPGMDGIEVCSRIKAQHKWQAIPIIMVTALTEKEDLARCLNAGADDFLSKPVNGLELRARVNSMLRLKQQYDKIQAFSRLQKNTINLLKRNLQELKGNLASSLPHELNTPLTGILGGLNLLISDYQNMEVAEVKELLSLAYESSLRLQNLTQKFLLYTELELRTNDPNNSNLKKLNPQEIPDDLFIFDVAQTEAIKCDRIDDLIFDLEQTKIPIRKNDLKNIITELLENALKFSHPGSPVKIIMKVINNTFNLFITDQGKGMTHEQIAQISAFRQFERQSYDNQGVGLGLQIVNKTVKIYGGKLLISSIYKEKTTIHLELPLND